MEDQTRPVRLNGSVLDASAGTLMRGSSAVPIRPKSFALLAFLVTRQGQVVPKNDIIDAVWPDVTVTDDSLTQAVRDVRVALQDERGHLLQTIRGRGYLLDLAGSTSVPEAGLTDPDHLPRLGIVPFELRQGTETFASRIEMLGEEIAAGLTRYRTFRVLSTGSIRSAAKESEDPVAISARLNADYLIEGIAHPAQDGFLLRLSLNHMASRSMVWSETFDCAEDVPLDAVGGIVTHIIGRLSSGMEVEAIAQSISRPTDNLTVLDHIAQGQMLWANDDPVVARVAAAHFRAATELDPNFALAWSYRAWAEMAIDEYSLAPPDVLARVLGYAHKAVSLAPFEGRAISCLGYVQALIGDFEIADANAHRGLALNPSSVDCMLDCVTVLTARGRPVDALRILDQVAILNPMRVGHETHLRGEALFMMGRYSEAADVFFSTPSLPSRRRVFLAAMLAKAGRTAECIAQLETVQRSDPDWDHLGNARRAYRYELDADNDHLAEAITLALSLWKGGGCKNTSPA